MKIKHSIYLLALVLVLLPPTGCKKFLQKTDTSNVAADALFKKPEDGIQLINALYNTFDEAGHDDVMKFSIAYINNLLSLDHLNYGEARNWTTYSFATDHKCFSRLWDEFYKGIALANGAIPIIAKMKADNILDQSLADRLTGETYFLRGLFYYYLGSAFGGVPLELKTLEAGDNGLHPRNTQDEVFTSVAADMTTAASLLPEKENIDKGRATKGAALGYLGAAQLWLKKYTEAIATYDQLTGKYSLLPKYLDIHEYSNQDNDESLFQVKYLIPGGATRSWGRSNDANWEQNFNMPPEVSGNGYESVMPELYNSFENGDTRKWATVIGPGDVHPSPAIQIKNYSRAKSGFASGDPKFIGTNGQIINTCGTVALPWQGSDPGQLRTGYYNGKTWRDPLVNADSLFSDQSIILLRFGEILISKAEAQFKSGDAAGALATIQVVRNRAWGGVAPAPVETDVMKIILNEYRHEINGEWSLWFDLRRSGSLVDYIKDKHGLTIPQGRDVLPIPAAAIATNPKLVQNPGY